jgi:hypothetical protein
MHVIYLSCSALFHLTSIFCNERRYLAPVAVAVELLSKTFVVAGVPLWCQNAHLIGNAIAD